MKKNLLSFAFLSLSILTLLSSCTKENTAPNTIEGTWDVSSYKINGDELIGVAFEDLAVDFGTYQNAEGKIVIYTTTVGNSPDANTGTYTIEDNNGVVTITTHEEAVRFNYAIDRGNLTLFGVDAEGKSCSMVARK